MWGRKLMFCGLDLSMPFATWYSLKHQNYLKLNELLWSFCISVVGSAMAFSFSQGMQHATHAAGCSWEPLAAGSNWGSPTAGSPLCPLPDLWLLARVFVISLQLWSHWEQGVNEETASLGRDGRWKCDSLNCLYHCMLLKPQQRWEDVGM